MGEEALILYFLRQTPLQFLFGNRQEYINQLFIQLCARHGFDDTNMSSQHDRHKSIGVELFTLGDYFSICVMQPGKNPAFVKELMHSFASCSIDCKLMSEERFRLADYKLPYP